MPHAQLLNTVREVVRSSFAELGAGRECELSEHILIREDLYCGRRFRCGQLQAVWFIEEDEIKIYGPDNAVVRVLHGSQFTGQAARRQAA
jgi:hypothetical protein